MPVSLFSKSTKESPKTVALNWHIESPPVNLHGLPDESAGALLTGQMSLEVHDECSVINEFSASLHLRVSQKRPQRRNCAACQHHYAELKIWSFLNKTTTLGRGHHYFPFSALLNGDLPACLDSPLLTISYEFSAFALVSGNPRTYFNPPIKVDFAESVVVRRSVSKYELPRHSHQLFPSTDLKARVKYDKIIHPSCVNKFSFQLQGPVVGDKNAGMMMFWQLVRATWRLEETIKVTAQPCGLHLLESNDGAAKSQIQTEVRLIGQRDLFEGWRSDFTNSNGMIEMELDYFLNESKPYICDTKTGKGIEVTHALVIRLSVSRVCAPDGKIHLARPTGVEHVVRMRYAVVLAEDHGTSISWDNEVLPIYQDTSSSPPEYHLREALMR